MTGKNDDLKLDDEADVQDNAVGEIVIEALEDAGDSPSSAKKSPPSLDEGAEHLRKQLDAEKRRAADAEKRAMDAEAKVQSAQADVQDTQLKLVETAILSKADEAANLKRQYSHALASGDYDAAADIQLQMSRNAAEQLNLENGKLAMENQAKQPKVQQRGSEVEDFAAQMRANGYPRSAEWVRNHPEYVTSQRMNQKMIAAHQIAIADGHAADTDDYFSAVEKVLGISDTPAKRGDIPHDDAAELAAKPVSRRAASEDGAAPPAAPVSRNPPTNGGNRPQVVRLSAEEREMAALSGLTEQEYARNKLSLKKEGRLN